MYLHQLFRVLLHLIRMQLNFCTFFVQEINLRLVLFNFGQFIWLPRKPSRASVLQAGGCGFKPTHFLTPTTFRGVARLMNSTYTMRHRVPGGGSSGRGCLSFVAWELCRIVFQNCAFLRYFFTKCWRTMPINRVKTIPGLFYTVHKPNEYKWGYAFGTGTQKLVEAVMVHCYVCISSN